MIEETERTERLGGSCERTDVGESLRDARLETVVHPAARIESLPIGECTPQQRDESPAPCRRFGATARWRLATDE